MGKYGDGHADGVEEKTADHRDNSGGIPGISICAAGSSSFFTGMADCRESLSLCSFFREETANQENIYRCSDPGTDTFGSAFACLYRNS